MVLKKIDNFKKWRDEMKMMGGIKTDYPPLLKDEKTAELIGLILGDGNLYAHERVGRLLLSFDRKYPRIVERGVFLIEKVFKKKPKVSYVKNAKCVRIWIYEKNISERLEIPFGAKKKFDLRIPDWIWVSEKYLLMS